MKLFAFETSVGAVVFRREGNELKFLLLEYQNGHWGFPKGHIEKGEGQGEALIREIKEETNIDIDEIEIIPGFFAHERYFYAARGEERAKRIENKKGIFIFKTVFYYMVETNEDSIILYDEHTDFDWLPFQEAVELLTFKNSKSILKRAFKVLKKRKAA